MLAYFFFVLVATQLFTTFPGINAIDPYLHVYKSYLQSFQKDLSRLSNPDNLSAFKKSYEHVINHNQCQYATAAQNSSCFLIKLSVFSDWSVEDKSTFFHEIPTSLDSRKLEDTRRISQFRQSEATSFEVEHKDPLASIPKEINWGSSSNPVGYSVLSPVRNQGGCGACWAFVAIAASEASIRIAKARAMKPIHTGNISTAQHHGDIKAGEPNDDEDREIARVAEDNGQKFVFLSPQELIDCDTADGNKGCYGGRPLMAFNYMQNYGVASWEQYPFFGQQGYCASSSITSIGFVSGVESISSSNEAAILYALASFGPVAVGVCGSDEDFMHYSSGIFDSATCCVLQNHAITLVGYGVDEDTGLPYWLAQNSWGSDWGEKGFIKILRSTSQSAGLGVCGLAINPMIPFGGYLAPAVPQEGIYAWFRYWAWVIERECNGMLYTLGIWLEEMWQILLLTVALSLCTVSCVVLTVSYVWKLRWNTATGSSFAYSSIPTDAVDRPSSSGNTSASVSRNNSAVSKSSSASSPVEAVIRNRSYSDIQIETVAKARQHGEGVELTPLGLAAVPYSYQNQNLP